MARRTTSKATDKQLVKDLTARVKELEQQSRTLYDRMKEAQQALEKAEQEVRAQQTQISTHVALSRKLSQSNDELTQALVRMTLSHYR